RPVQIKVSDVAQVVAEGAHHLGAEAQVQGELRVDLPVILDEKPEVIVPILVVVNSAATEAEVGGAHQPFRKVGIAIRIVIWIYRQRSVYEEELAVECLREEFVKVHPCVFTAKTNAVCALHPADGVDEVVVVLRLKLIRRRRGTDLVPGTAEGKF